MYFVESIDTFLVRALHVFTHVSSYLCIEPVEDKEKDYYHEWKRNWYFHCCWSCWSKTIAAYFNSNASGFPPRQTLRGDFIFHSISNSHRDWSKQSIFSSPWMQFQCTSPFPTYRCSRRRRWHVLLVMTRTWWWFWKEIANVRPKSNILSKYLIPGIQITAAIIYDTRIIYYVNLHF